MPLTHRQLNRTTLARQMLLRRERLGVPEAVRRITAIQAQEPASPYVALWNRLEGFAPSELDRAFRDEAVVKATLMRITLHAVHTADYTAFHSAMEANLRASRLYDRRFKETGLSIEEVDRALVPLLDHVSSARTVPEIQAMLTDRLGDPLEPRIWWALKTFAPLMHAPVEGPWSFGRRPSFRVAPTTPPRPDPSTALQRLVWRYLEAFGPASAKDFGQFALQRMGPTGEALDALGESLVTYVGPEGEQLFDVPDAPLSEPDVPAPPRLMAMWDSVLLAYFDRGRVIPEDLRSVVIRRNGDVLPTVLVDGHVAGVWRVAEGTIETRVFRQIDSPTGAALDSEALALLEMLGDRDLNPYGRYDHWWDKLPDGEDRLLAR